MRSRIDAQEQVSIIRDEHRQLAGFLTQLDAVQDVKALRTILADLAELVDRHFAREESSQGLHAIVSAQAPHMFGRTAHMLNEHNVILDQLRALAREASASRARLASLRPAIDKLAATMRAHEEAERDLLSESMTVDLGAGG